MFRKLRIAHLALASHLSRLNTGLPNCTRILEKITTKYFFVETVAISVLKGNVELLNSVYVCAVFIACRGEMLLASVGVPVTKL